MSQIGVVTGMVAEARCLPRLQSGEASAVLCSGGDAGRAGEGARQLLAGGAEGLLSFGLAGGLDPALRPGDVVVADCVVDRGGESWQADRTWLDAVLALAGLPRPVAGVVAGSDRPLASAVEKATLFAATGACAVDMESHAVARVASENGVPFAVLRVVADPADRALPRAALVGLGADGRTRPMAVLGQLALRPGDIGATLRLAVDRAVALRALRRVATASAVPLFGGTTV